jgi:hypothetical protein
LHIVLTINLTTVHKVRMLAFYTLFLSGKSVAERVAG